MDALQVSKKFFAAAIILCAVASCNQKNEDNPVWKKQVARVIDIQEKEDTTSNHPKGAATDTTLVEMLIHGIKAGKITAYSNADRTTPLTVADIDHMIIAAPDTVTILDPVNGGEQTMVVTHDFDYGAIHKYRILEEWAYNPATANTNIHIAGVAPVRDIYGSDGSFRGVQAMFWVHYTDIQDVLARYAQHHPDNNLVAGIWNDYFLNNEKQALLSEKIIKKLVV